MFDAYYTPQVLAEEMVDAVPSTISPSVIADFAVGGGSLLRAAALKWPDALLVGNDIDKPTVARLRREFPWWLVSSADFLLTSSFVRTYASDLAGQFDLVLLNPPFSIRGNTRVEVCFGEVVVKCGLAMAFLLRAAELLSKKGCIVAIIPAGSFSSGRDEDAWRALSRIFEVEVVSHNEKNAFGGVFPLTKIVRLMRKIRPKPPTGVPEMINFGGELKYNELVRGRIQMFKSGRYIDSSGIPLVHTSNIKNGVVLAGTKKVSVDWGLTGPLVLLPRVGNPSPSKVAVYMADEPITLSDCVIGLRCETERSTQLIVKRIHREWSTFEDGYGGTGAPYISVRRLTELLGSLNIRLGCSG